MVETKQQILDSLTGRLQLEFESLLECLIEGGRKEQKPEEASGRLKAIQEAIKVTEKSPNWPFQVNAIYRLGATVVFPFVFAIFEWMLTLFDLIRELVVR